MPSAKLARRRIRTCRWPAQVASRAEVGAPLGGHVAGAGAAADGALAPVRLQHAHRSLFRARSGRADRKLRALHAWLPSEPGGTPASGGLVSLDSKGLVTKLIAGWIVLPAL